MQRLKALGTQTLFDVPTGASTQWRVPVTGQVSAWGSPIWLTREGDPQDYWLEPGRTLTVSRGDVLWLSVDGQRGGQLALSSGRAPVRALWQNGGQGVQQSSTRNPLNLGHEYRY